MNQVIIMLKNKDCVERLKKSFGFVWRDEDLLHQALTHSSYTYEKRLWNA